MRNILCWFVPALATWMLMTALGNLGLRAGMPDYAKAELTMQFSTVMLCLRLLVGFSATMTAGILAGYVDRSGYAGLRLGGLFLLIFGANHVYLWAKFPVWFHLGFLFSLLPATVAGAQIGKRVREHRQVSQQPLN